MAKNLRKLIENRKYWCYTIANITYLYNVFSWKKNENVFVDCAALCRGRRTAIEINWEWNERQSLAEDFAEELCQSGNCGG